MRRAPGRRHAITWTDTASLLFGFLAKKVRWIRIKTRKSYSKNALENIACKTTAICLCPKLLNSHFLDPVETEKKTFHQHIPIFLTNDSLSLWVESGVFSSMPYFICKLCDVTCSCHSVSPATYEIHVNPLRDKLCRDHTRLWLSSKSHSRQ